MSNLDYIEKLLDGENIGWMPLSEVTQYEQPTKYLVKSKNYDDEWETPVLTAGKTFLLGYTNETQGIYPASQNPVIIFDDFTTANKWVDFDFKAKSSAMKMITSRDEERFSLKYVYHWLNTLPSGLIEGDHKRQWISNFSEKKSQSHALKTQKSRCKSKRKSSESWTHLPPLPPSLPHAKNNTTTTAINCSALKTVRWSGSL